MYVHVPFCERVCPYCDFAVIAARPLTRELEDRFVAAQLAVVGLLDPGQQVLTGVVHQHVQRAKG